jgi:hypothetical protein
MWLWLVLGCYPPSGGLWEKIGEGHWLVAGWAQSTHTDAAAEETAVWAVLITERAGLAGWAFVDGAWPRRSRWDHWKRSWVAPPPCRLAARISAEALSTHAQEPSPADGADR